MAASPCSLIPRNPMFRTQCVNLLYLIWLLSLPEQASQSQANMLLREGMLLYGLSHTNIQRIKAICIEDPSRPLLVYPYISQGNLKTFLQKCKFSPEGHTHVCISYFESVIFLMLDYSLKMSVFANHLFYN